MTGFIEIPEKTKYAPKHAILKSLQEKKYLALATITIPESNLTNSLYDIPYSELKESMVKDFEKKVEKVHAKYEELVYDITLNALKQLNSEIVDLNNKLSDTILAISSKD